ncbi:MAG: OmpA family protein, partial [Sandaracinaceae bacterium]|nr:OmpA family protein [Sandaracinaceae bacterium]
CCAPGAFRTQLGLDFFFLDGWLCAPGVAACSDQHSHIGGSLSLSWNPFEFFEVYAAIASYANSNAQEDPALFQVLGDTTLGAKGFYRVLPWLTLGGDLSLTFLNTVGDIGLVFESTSVGIRANATADLRELESSLPIIARLNLQYFVDNSTSLINRVEQARYDALPTSGPDARRPMEFETRHLITRIERYSLQIDRTDRFTIGVGFEFPFRVMENFHISPIAEWILNIPVNRNNYDCLYITGVGTDVPPPGEDGCLDRQGAGAFEQWATLGVRVMPPLRGLALFLAVDIGFTGTNTFVRELSGISPYDIRLGFAYAHDTVPEVREVTHEVERRVEVPAPVPPRGRILGTIVEQGANTPIASAIVSFPGRELNALQATESGTFRSPDLDPGEVQMSVTHPEYNQGSCSGTIPEAGGDVEVRCELEALPRLGNVRGRVLGEGAAPVGGASVAISGPASRTIVTGPDGTFSISDLTPGTYSARVEAEAFLIKQETFEVRPRETATPEITLVARPRRSLVTLRSRDIVIRRQVNFATDSAEILPDSSGLLSEVADVLLRHPELLRVEIQGHTDNRGGQAHNQDLSQRRAESVRDWLVNAGVSAGRLEAHGYGQDRPLVPNITAANRARNRRVQFVIQERSDTGGE